MLCIRQRIDFGSLARTDALTGLPNRLAAREHFAALTAGQDQTILAVHYLDLDKFKPVNDRFGHAAGDALLVAVAERLRRLLRGGDLVTRLGGDEFLVLQCHLANQAEARVLAERLTGALERPFRIGEHTIGISASIGTVVCDGPEHDLDRLLEEADRALYRAKR